MTSDFRTATTERRVQNRLAYLESLASAPGLADEERLKFETAVSEHQAILDTLREESAGGHRVSDLGLPVPVHGSVPALEDCHAYPVYVPPVRVLQKWRAEAKLGVEAYGDQRDEHRRVLVLLEVMEDLLRILAEEEVKLTPSAKNAEDGLIAEEDRPSVSESTDSAPV